MADSAQDRKLPASRRKIEKARADGQVARSRDLGHFTAVAGGVALLLALAPELSDWMTRLLATGLRFDAAQVSHPDAMLERLLALSLQMFAVLAPLFVTMVVVALAAGLLSGGWNFTLKPLLPDFSKLNPLAGLGRVFSGDQLTTTLKACLLALVLGGVGALYLMVRWNRHAEMLAMPLPAALAAGGALLETGLLLLCAVLAAFALVDVPLQRELLLRRLRMSVEEMKKEFKEQEGNAEMKGAMRRRMREMANKRMMAQVPLADLVVMNPTHYAVALKYEDGKMAAPKVLAKGADLLAMKIRDIAREAKVPVLQAPALARALYAHAEIDQEIPARLFGAVAQVLAWVYQLRDAMAAGRVVKDEAPTPEVPADLDPHNKIKPGDKPDAPAPTAGADA
jgi:flagellar biosynthetic protein FlhB